jgi:hypothetical protein
MGGRWEIRKILEVTEEERKVQEERKVSKGNKEKEVNKTRS